MAIGLVGRKVGMTRIFTEDGTSIPVTVIEATPNRVTQLRTEELDGYRALQVTTGSKKTNRVNKAEAGHFAKAGVEATKARIKSAIANVEMAKAGVLSAKALFGSAESSVAAVNKELSRLEIHAPFSGYLETNTAELGSLMQPGSLLVF